MKRQDSQYPSQYLVVPGPGFVSMVEPKQLILNRIEYFLRNRFHKYSLLKFIYIWQKINCMIWLLRIIAFFSACFFLLPFFRVEDPFRSIALRFFSIPGKAKIYNHSCEGDRVYLYEYSFNSDSFQQRYDGYNEILDYKIPENIRCKGTVFPQVEIDIRYFPYFRFWSEPMDAERPSFLLFLMVNVVKLFSIVLLILTFIRKRN